MKITFITCNFLVDCLENKEAPREKKDRAGSTVPGEKQDWAGSTSGKKGTGMYYRRDSCICFGQTILGL